MSYILEALTDSERERQQIAAAPKYSLLPVVGEEPPQQRRWPYAVAVALLVNAVVLYLWLPPVLPGGAGSIKDPTAPPAVETPAAAPKASAASLVRNEKSAADAAGTALGEARPSQSRPERVNESRIALPTASADAVPGTASAGRTNENASIGMPKLAPKPVTQSGTDADVAMPARPTPSTKLTPKVTAKRSDEVAVTSEVNPTPAAPKVIARRSAEAVAATVPTPTPASASAPAPTSRETPKQAGGTAELPTALQKELPALSVAGFIHDEGSSSMVIVNDRLVREGDEVAPGVKLEKILSDGLIFNYKGYLFKR